MCKLLQGNGLIIYKKGKVIAQLLMNKQFTLLTLREE